MQNAKRKLGNDDGHDFRFIFQFALCTLPFAFPQTACAGCFPGVAVIATHYKTATHHVNDANFLTAGSAVS
jgi:hypothetical protein